MRKLLLQTLLLTLLGCLISNVTFATDKTFKILRIKGQVTLNTKTVKIGDEYSISEIENLEITTKDESGFVVVCFNNCSKNKVVLEKTINILEATDKRKLIETTAFKSRGKELASFPELVNYFEKKPILILGDSRLPITQSVLEFPKSGSYLDLYYSQGNEEFVHQIPYENKGFLFKEDLFTTEDTFDAIIGPITLTMVDPKGAKENLITEEFYVSLINTTEIEKQIKDMVAIGLDNIVIAEGIVDCLRAKYPDYFIDDDFVKQFVDNQE